MRLSAGAKLTGSAPEGKTAITRLTRAAMMVVKTTIEPLSLLDKQA